MTKNESIKNLMQIPGVGKSIANDLYAIGIFKIEDLINREAEDLFDLSNAIVGAVQDRCPLYVFRGAVYFAETPAANHNPEKLKWWNWSDKNLKK